MRSPLGRAATLTFVQKTTTMKVREKSENKNPCLKLRESLLQGMRRMTFILDYFQDDSRLAQQLTSGHTIAKVSLPVNHQ
jgi:hypothetical protein